ncbi:acyl-CoA dehydrogenase [Archangium violaceum]|uniref:acyl-CoA dehydrogenase C-terminal domain-containing protein n=1 Tax=Archangium violaceum TaxID=83451 RepID=UPI002B31C0D9|nr:acyl-CoA dehydrogenase [Archangium violaceum]
MPQYKVPLRDIRFLMNEVFDYPSHYKSMPNGVDATPDLVEHILKECARYCEQVLAPLNQKGDQDGCELKDGKVTTPRGFKDAYDQYVAGGWQGLTHPADFGGQGLPISLGMVRAEMMGTANWSFSMYPGLSLGAMNTLQVHASEEQKRTYLTPLTEGRWMGTMCLTEPQCGTDLGQVATKAIPQADGSYKLTGTKIFISAGDHDLTENIVHIVLARLPDAPKGTRGISLFLVPKYLPDGNGGVGPFNHVVCSALEHKMGIRGSATAVLNFEESTGFLVGTVNKGLECMFTFMNTARIGTAVQGVAAAELSYQGALAYSKDRRSMRSLSGAKEPNQIADALHHHADVRRMLLTQKAIAEGGRAMLYSAAMLADKMMVGILKNDEKERLYWDDKLGFFTPILKGFLTELGFECANLGMQVFGGHGYIQEHGMEQIVRDARIATLYEGTTGIQALDLLGRKVLLLTRGKAVREFTATIMKLCTRNATHRDMYPFIWTLGKLCAQWNWLTTRLMLSARKDRDMIGSAAVDYLMYAGYVSLAYNWALMAEKSFEKLEKGGAETPEFYRAKIQTAEFYFERLLPRAQAHAEGMLSPSKSVMQLPIDHFTFD